MSARVVEYRFFEAGTIPFVSTAAFHAERERAPHLEQDAHRLRLLRVAQLIKDIGPSSVVDLGCGDGGLLSLLWGHVPAWGYDFQPSNYHAWGERGVTAELMDVFNARDNVRWGELAVVTEVLEHLADPHGVVAWIAEHAKWIVASSPSGIDTPERHAVEHAWGWDDDGYAELFDPYFQLIVHERCDWSQIVVGVSKLHGQKT